MRVWEMRDLSAALSSYLFFPFPNCFENDCIFFTTRVVVDLQIYNERLTL